MWRDEGIMPFNTLLYQVKEDCTENHECDMNWLEARHKAQVEDGTTPKKYKCQLVPQMCSELFESEGKGDEAPFMNEEPLTESGSESGEETDYNAKNGSLIMG
jgi:hypothetical protein